MQEHLCIWPEIHFSIAVWPPFVTVSQPLFDTGLLPATTPMFRTWAARQLSGVCWKLKNVRRAMAGLGPSVDRQAPTCFGGDRDVPPNAKRELIDFKRSVMDQDAEPRFRPAMLRNKTRQTFLVSICIVQDDAGLGHINPGGLIGGRLTVVRFDEIQARVVDHAPGSDPLQIHQRLGKKSWVLLDAIDRPRGINRRKNSRDPTVAGSRVDHNALWR